MVYVTGGGPVGSSCRRTHVSVSSFRPGRPGRFRSFDEMRADIDEAYTEDGDGAPPPSMTGGRGLGEYEPVRIEADPSESGQPVPLEDLLAGVSYSDQWPSGVDGGRLADDATCVFALNQITRPRGRTL